MIDTPPTAYRPISFGLVKFLVLLDFFTFRCDVLCLAFVSGFAFVLAVLCVLRLRLFHLGAIGIDHLVESFL